ncbi:MAG: arsenite transporter [Deltaproteobacteria bacterium]|nr:MAG: arsenite transporter [Deltaproteobacteria bacterium]
MLWSFLGKINKNLTLAIPAMMVAGFIFGLLVRAAPLKSAIMPLTFLMVYPMMVNLKVKKVFEGGDTKAQLITQLINFAVIPFFAYGVGLLFFEGEPYMALGLLLAALVPTSGMTISWTGFAKGNLAAAVKMTVVGLILGSLATPFYVQFLMGKSVDINITSVMGQIALIVFLPMAVGFATQQWLVKRYGQDTFQKVWSPRFPPLSTLGVLGIVFVAMALKARQISSEPTLIINIFLPLLVLYAANFALSTIVGKMLLPRGDAIALVYGTVMRNLSIALAVAISSFGEEGSYAALVLCVAYIIQVQAAAWYVKFTDKIFGAPA